MKLVLVLLIIKTVSAKNFIHNGKRVLTGQFRSIVYLKVIERDGIREKPFSCAGTLISETFVITAAHCLIVDNTSRELRNTVYAYFGSVNLNKFQYKRTAKNVIIHENYDKLDESNTYDIGLIELDSPADISYRVEVAHLPETTPAPNTLLDIVGWGLTETNDGSQDLLYVTIPVLDDNTCQNYTDIEDQSLVICVLNELEQGACGGDSGGPFYLHGSKTVVGITSFGFDDNFGKCNTKKPSVATNIYHFLDWINKRINTIEN